MCLDVLRAFGRKSDAARGVLDERALPPKWAAM